MELPGLNRLVAVCRAYSLRADLNAPLAAELAAQPMLLGQPLDPVLAMTLSRHNGAIFNELAMLPMDDSTYGIGPLNLRRRADKEWRFANALLYGKFAGSMDHLATVPALADSAGVQPVVFIGQYIDPEIMPIASSVDRAFDLYARYLAASVARYGSIESGRASLEFSFPRDLPEFIAEDRRLVELLKAGRFDAFTAIDPGLPEWRASIERAAQGRS